MFIDAIIAEMMQYTMLSDIGVSLDSNNLNYEFSCK